MVEVCLAGTGGTVPLAYRWLTCCFVEIQGKALLIDCGEGTQIALKKSKCKLSKINGILITHFHADHVSGLPGLLLTLGNSGKTTPLVMIGAAGLSELISHLLSIAPFLPYPLEIVELSATEPDSFNLGNFHIASLPLTHGITCLGYGISFFKKPIFNPQKAEALGIPKNYFQALHCGGSVVINGQEFTPNMVLEGDRSPVKMVYMTDSSPVPEMVDFANQADLLICEGMHGDDAMKEKMAEKGHMLFSDAAAVAQEAGVKELWLTHFSPALHNPEDYLSVAQAIFQNAIVGQDGMRKTLI